MEWMRSGSEEIKAFAESETGPAAKQRIAPIWHTAVLVAVLLVFSLLFARSPHRITTAHGRLVLYVTTMAWEKGRTRSGFFVNDETLPENFISLMRMKRR
jgi:hypothetical protein